MRARASRQRLRELLEQRPLEVEHLVDERVVDAAVDRRIFAQWPSPRFASGWRRRSRWRFAPASARTSEAAILRVPGFAASFRTADVEEWERVLVIRSR
ncbi:MAG TPA: hypothetical protein VIL18_06500 [Longimicrobiales bacterium]